jgi:hypothetical protein
LHDGLVLRDSEYDRGTGRGKTVRPVFIRIHKFEPLNLKHKHVDFQQVSREPPGYLLDL